ncbi:MAG: heme-binding beta-barrel domain-containing protein [Acidimicrobiales bacterium]
MPPEDISPALAPLAFLVGTWRGRGRGTYPTVAGFDYNELLVISASPKPYLTWSQRTWSPGGVPLHAEAGFLRAVGQGSVELVLAHPNGIVEIEQGAVSGTEIELRSTTVVPSPTAKDVAEIGRHLSVAGDTLTYVLDMAAVGVPFGRHLEATLRREETDDDR